MKVGFGRGGTVLPTFCLFAGGGLFLPEGIFRPRPAPRLVREPPAGRELPPVFGSAPLAGGSEVAGGVETGNEYLSGVASITSKARQSSSLLSPSDKIWTGGWTSVLPRC